MKARLFLSVGVFLLIVVFYAPDSVLGGHQLPSPLLPGNPLAGSRLFTEKGCFRCHSIHGTGGVAGPDLGQGILNRPLLEIAGVMWNHSPGMEHVYKEQRAARPKFEPQEMASLLAFLYYLGSLDPPGDSSTGARLFREKGCRTCHSVGGEGGRVGPKLDKYGRYASPIYLTAVLWNRGQAMANSMKARGVSRATFEAKEISDLLAYIRDAGSGVERIYITPGRPQRGKKLFTEKHCIECHSIKEHGGKVEPDLGATLKGSLMQIAGAMWNHGPRMWATMAEAGIDIPIFSAQDMSDLISYLYFLQFIDAPGDAQKGKRLYNQRGCSACHGALGGGGAAGPNLAMPGKLETPLEVITAMWNHATKMEEKLQELSVAWPILKGGEMADLIAYLLSVRAGQGQPTVPNGSERKPERQ
ncbi:MAG: c-type cytochrome [Candidatus Binatia bacterium]